MSKKTERCLKCNTTCVLKKSDTMVCEYCKYTFSKSLLENTYIKKVAQEYSSRHLSDMLVIWMSILLMEIIISSVARTILRSIRDDDFVDLFINANYRISYTKKIILLFIKFPNEMRTRVSVFPKGKFDSRKNVDSSFADLTQNIDLQQTLNQYLSTMDNYPKIDFDENFARLKEYRHNFRRGINTKDVDINEVRELTYEYISRLSRVLTMVLK